MNVVRQSEDERPYNLHHKAYYVLVYIIRYTASTDIKHRDAYLRKNVRTVLHIFLE